MNEKLQELADECRRNFMFSKKIEGGYIGPKGEFIPVPAGIRRVGFNYANGNGGWRIDLKSGNKAKTRLEVRDSPFHHDYMASLQEALRQLHILKPEGLLKSQTRHAVKEHAHKKIKLGVVGVRFNTAFSRGHCYHSFIVMWGKKRKTIPIPRDYTQAQFDAGLEKAKTIRQEFERIKLEKSRFTTDSK